jgi:chitinase
LQNTLLLFFDSYSGARLYRMQFMSIHGFSGVDLDCEFPQSQSDGRAFVTLLGEMHGAFNGHYGISVILPPETSVLAYFYPYDMQDHVDFFNIMSYDYTTPSRSATVQLHTSMDKIESSLEYMWKNHIDSKNINIGLAYYAYAYTLKGPSCTSNGCPSTGVRKELGCTNEPDGVLPLFVIDSLLVRFRRVPYVNQTACVVELTWDTDQFVSFDNSGTLDLKLQRANELCLGGTMVWSISDATVKQQNYKRVYASESLADHEQAHTPKRKHVGHYAHAGRHHV